MAPQRGQNAASLFKIEEVCISPNVKQLSSEWSFIVRVKV